MRSATSGPQRIPLWVDLRDIPINKRLPYLHAVRDVAAERVVLAKDDAHHDRPGLAAVTVDGKNRLLEGKRAVGRIAKVSDGKSQTRAAAAEGILVVDSGPDRIIPLENLIAARQDRPGTLFARAVSSQEARLCATILERGVHGVLLAPASPADILATDHALRLVFSPPATTLADAGPAVAAPTSSPAEAMPTLSSPPKPPAAPASATATSAISVATPGDGRIVLTAATLTRIHDGGLGDRVCVDLTSLLEDGEGLLVGSTAGSLALVHAETAGSDFIAARPFRVNAGAVHSYLLGPGGKTAYLSELAAGSPVLAVQRSGTSRTLTVGRVKIERRPHLILHWASPNGPASAAVQNAETIRLVRPDGSATPVTELRPGDAILVHHGAAARHTGLAVSEAVQER